MTNQLRMIGSYIKIAFRNLLRNRLVAFINIFGLGLSMSIGMMELVRLQDATSYDRFHPHPDRTYRIISSYRQKDGQHWKMASTPLPLYTLLKADTADIEEAVNLYPGLQGTAVANGKELSLNGALTEPAFFTIFGFRLAAGDPLTALKQPNSIVLTKTTAEKFFGPVNPMGKVISMGNKGNFVVTGVLAESGKSHIDFNAYASSSAIPRLVQTKQLPDKSNDWIDCSVAYTYVLVKNGSGSTSLKGQLNSAAASSNRLDKSGVLSFDFQPITNVSPASADTYNEIGRGTAWSKLWIEIDIVLLLLIAACFNYTNLTVARALTRAKEVGVRKINGARRYQIFLQYIVEACVTAFLALGFAGMLFSLIIRYAPFNDGYEMVPSSFHYTFSYILSILGFALFTGLLAGLAPAWILSAFRPLRVLKNLSTAKIFGSVGLQKTLIVFQYSLSLVIIIFLFAFYRQFAYMSSADHGFRRDNVLVVPLNGVDKDRAANAIAATGGINSVSGLSCAFTPHYEGRRGPGWINNGQKETLSFNYFFADRWFIPSMKISLLAGHNFTADADSTGEKSVIINSKAAHLLGFTAVENALGNQLRVDDSTSLEIVGITKDFAYECAGKPIDAMAFRNKKGACNYLYIDVGRSDKTTVTSRITSAWKTIAPAQPFTSSWLDDDLENNDSQRATISLLGYLAFMAVSIATLGLLGLVIYSVEIKRKEISIRKVIGASQTQLVRLLSRRFVKLLILSGAIGLPIGYTMSFLFQMNFADRVGSGLLSAVLCFVLLFCIGLVTIISQTYTAAMENPARNLKVE